MDFREFVTREHQTDKLHVVEAEHRESGCCIIAALGKAGARRHLLPVRVLRSAGGSWAEESSSVMNEARRQIDNLQEKIEVTDRLHLANIRLSDEFVAGRYFLWAPQGVPDEVAFRVAEDGLALLRSAVPQRIVARLDFDQRRKHPALGLTLDEMDFTTKHEPSSMATLAIYEAILESYGVRCETGRWGVNGLGELGSRIALGIVARSPSAVLVHDIDARRSDALRSIGCHPTTHSELIHADVHAQVMAADAGTFTLDVAHSFAAQNGLIAFGGPQAGLDHAHEQIEVLVRAGKHFVPSLLCGSLGLIGNLSEAIGEIEPLEFQEHRMRDLSCRLTSEARQAGVSFHEALARHLVAEAIA